MQQAWVLISASTCEQVPTKMETVWNIRTLVPSENEHTMMMPPNWIWHEKYVDGPWTRRIFVATLLEHSRTLMAKILLGVRCP